MEFEKAYLNRRSIRKYKDKEIPLSLVGEILDLACFAPSSGNLQNWRFVVVTDQNIRQEIADACLQQTWMIDAPVFIVVCNEYNEVKSHYGKLGKMYSIQNCANVATGIMLVAADKGLGSCWVGSFDNEAIQRILKIPESVDPEIIITLGYSNEVKQPSLREDLSTITFFNSWSNKFASFPSHLEKFKASVKKQFQKIKKK